jgi:ketosteroid isomerase-like protein
MSDTPRALMERLRDAQNAQDVAAFVECVADSYESDQPNHPARAFTGRDQVRANWTEVFGAVRDFHSEIVAMTVDGDTAWTEWHWTGALAAGGRLEMRGVTIFTVRDGRIARGRLYMEPVDAGNSDIEDNMRRMTEG